MSKVETKSVTGYQGTSLLYMATKYGTQRFMKQMGCTEWLREVSSRFSLSTVHGYFIAHLEHTLCYNTDMTDLATLQMNRIFYFKHRAVQSGNLTDSHPPDHPWFA